MNRPGISRDFATNLLGALLPILASLVTLPLYLSQIGVARYGVVSLCWVLLGMFAFFDFGMSRASAQALARLDVTHRRERGRVLMTTLFVNTALGLVGGLILYAVGQVVLLHLVKLSPGIAQETMRAFPWMAAMLPLGMIGSVLPGTLESRGRFVLSNLLGTAGTLLGQLLPLFCAYVAGPSLSIVIPALLGSRALMTLVGLACVMRIERPERLLDLDLAWARRLFRYGSWVSVSSLVNPILDSANQLVIGAMLGAGAVGHYAVPMTLAMRSQLGAVALARAMFPRISRMAHVDALQATQRSVSLLAYGFGALCAPAILLAGPFLELWMGHRFASSSTAAVAEMLMLGAWVNGIAYLPYGFLQAQGRPHVTALLALAEIVPFFLLLWLLIRVMGLPGAALAWTLRVTSNGVGLLILSKCLDRGMLRVLPAAVIMLVSTLVAECTRLPLPVTMALAVAAGCATVLFAYVFDPVVRESAQAVLLRVRRRKAAGLRNGTMQ